MWSIDAVNVEEYLRARQLIGAGTQITARHLSGGVSNEVLLLECPSGGAGSPLFDARSTCVLKQGRAQLRTPAPWFCGVERIWREVAVLRYCQQLAHPGQTPRILCEDSENYLFIMTAAPTKHAVWRDQLLAGQADPAIAAAAGDLLGTLHAASWHSAAAREAFDDREIFRQLRLDPYYAATARAIPEAKDYFAALIASVENHRRSLVHADFSPKNLLVSVEGIMLVDYETGHFGDPAFDLGFFLSHLVLKAFYHAPRHAAMLALVDHFWQAYLARIGSSILQENHEEPLLTRAMQNLAGCAWARLDGTSRVDYLTETRRRDAVRDFCRDLFQRRPADWQAAVRLLRPRIDQPFDAA